MKVDVTEFGLGIPCDAITPSAKSYRPPSWPPPSDWPITETKDGKTLSLYGQSIWDLSVLNGTEFKLDFCDGEERLSSVVRPIDHANADLLRLITAWRMYGPRPMKRVKSLYSNFFIEFRKIVSLCSSKGILASDLSQFPKVVDKIPGILSSSSFDTVLTELHKLWEYRDQLGFTLLDPAGIAKLARKRPSHETVQTAYIPPRIWKYQIEQLRKCLDDYLAHQSQFENCFNFYVDLYKRKREIQKPPIGSVTTVIDFAFPEVIYQTPQIDSDSDSQNYFPLVAEMYGIADLLKLWLGVEIKELTIQHLSHYLSLVQFAGMTYTINFTLQRYVEAVSLRTDCLYYEEDEKFGRVPIICGETTKTDQNSDARWVASPSVSVAIDALKSVAFLRIRCAAAHPDVATMPEDEVNPYLINAAYEPWMGGTVIKNYVNPRIHSYSEMARRFPKLFDEEELKITEDDLKVALLLTPNLPADRFSVGRVWPLAYHQLRRTGAVNMFASGDLSDSSIQYQLKHLFGKMSMYYGRGFTKLKLNGNTGKVVVAAMYEALSHSIMEAMDKNYISPHPEKNDELMNLITGKDATELEKMAKSGTISFRLKRFGACVGDPDCKLGGVESVSRCTGGDGRKPCEGAFYDRRKQPLIERSLRTTREKASHLPEASPRKSALEMEIKGMENYLDVVRKS